MTGSITTDVGRPAPATAAPLLEVEHLTMRFGGLTAIDNLSFTARQNEITALIGPNGAGKTTVFNCLTGFYRPTAGALTLHTATGAHKLERMDGFRIARAGVGRTFQNIRLFPSLSVLENLLIAQHNRLMAASAFSVAGLFGLPSYRKVESEALDLAANWLRRIDLLDHADRLASELPYGHQRRLEIARAMCTRPAVLCLDEPAAGLNPRESLELNNLLLSIRDQDQVGLMLIEHDMSVVMAISDHVVVLDYGRKIADDRPEAVRNDPNVIRAYLGEEEDEALPDAVAADLGIDRGTH